MLIQNIGRISINDWNIFIPCLVDDEHDLVNLSWV